MIHHVWVLVFQVTQVLLGQRPVLRVVIRVKNPLPELVGVEQPGLEGSMGLDVGVGGVGCYARVSGVRTEGFPRRTDQVDGVLVWVEVDVFQILRVYLRPVEGEFGFPGCKTPQSSSLFIR